MKRLDVEDYLQQGIHGKKEINPAERKRFLGTFRERVVIALTKAQVREEQVYQEVEDAVKAHPKAKLLLNGNMDYAFLSKYTQLSNQYDVPFTMVANEEHDSDLGLVLAYDYAIDKKEIFVTKKVKYAEKETKKGLFSSFAKVFKR